MCMVRSRAGGPRHTLSDMTASTNPVVGAVVSVALCVLGLYMLVSGSSNSAPWGWLFLVVGVLGVVANIGLYLRTRSR